MRHSLILLVISLFFIFGCAEDSSLVNPISGSDEATLVSFQPNSLTKSKASKTFFEKTFKKNKKNTLKFKVKGDISIKGKLKSKKNSFDQKNVKVSVDLSGDAGIIEFGPDGQEFNKGLNFSIKYEGVDFSGIDVENLEFVHIRDDGSIQVIEGAEIIVDEENGILKTTALIWHFSRYAFSSG